MSIVAQTTLAHDVSYNGIGLHAANEVHMVLIDTLSSNIKFENVASHATIPIKENVIMWL